jgi:membrane-associated HD superfamily phosphohydrolase
MNKALIEKAFEKWAEKHKTGVESKRDEVTAKTAFIAGATWQAEVSATSLCELESKVKELEVEIKELKDRCERYVWNLGGISTLLLGYNVDEFNQDYALPALKETNEYVKKHKELEKENDRLKNAQHEHFEQIVTALEMKNRELVTENEELKTMVNRNAGDAIYHQAEKIKLQDINATLKAQLDEAGEIIGGLLGTAKGYELEHRKDKLYTVRQRIERGDQFLAKLDLLEGEK